MQCQRHGHQSSLLIIRTTVQKSRQYLGGLGVVIKSNNLAEAILSQNLVGPTVAHDLTLSRPFRRKVGDIDITSATGACNRHTTSNIFLR